MDVQGHRGSPDPGSGILENTIDAFVRAARLGADGVELDVRLTRDGALAVHHDPVIPDVGPVADLDVCQLPAHVPLLDAAIDACTGLTVNVEIKNLPSEQGFDPGERLALAVGALVAERGTPENILVSSFWPPSLDAAISCNPDIRTGLLAPAWLGAKEALELAIEHGLGALHPQVSLLSPELVMAAHQAGLTVAAWTVNERSALRSALDWGVDTVITDDVASAAALVAAT
ncbi:MAG TPA: glycerophosphodiester phosphodiesterase [Acidimicrobiales bacterium]|jgi:glycerophosphoryl diester phosphodiesterase|nr:glycerophosphodiester phosphodiesterase [Acidimicrobiales bacterium]